MSAPLVEPKSPGPRPEVPAEEERRGLWAQARRLRLRDRPGVRLALGLAVVLGLLAVIPYPLNITAECRVLPAQHRYVRAAMEGVLSELLVDEGSVVHEGDVLARLDDRQLQAAREEALSQLERIRANVARMRHGSRPQEIARGRALVAARESATSYAAGDLARKRKLLEHGSVPPQEVEAAERDVRLAQGELDEARANLQLLLAGTRAEEIAAEEAELSRAEADLRYVELRLSTMVVLRSPMDGVVVTPRFRERLHEHVSAGDLVCEVARPGAMKAEIFVPERELDALRLGLPVTVKVASHPASAFRGKVDLIGSTVEPRAGLETLRVVTELEDPQGLLRQNMTGYGEIHADRQPVLSLMGHRLIRWIRVRFLI